MTERVIHTWEREFKKLQIVANALELASPNNAEYGIADVYLDFGQNWIWTTIVRYGYKECQVLNPREWKDIMNAETMEQFTTIVNEIRNDKYFGDK